MRPRSILPLSMFFLLWIAGPPARAAEKARVVSYYGYQDCIRLSNETTRVTLCPAAGGRVLEYALHGKNALYLPPGDEGWTDAVGKKGGRMTAGRFDIGPEQTIARRRVLWQGKWKGTITGPYSARLTSQKDKSTGVQLIRDFELDPKSSRLRCKQTIGNVSQATREYCHWSRTFAVGKGIVVIPLTNPSRFPHRYVMYGPGPAINFKPVDDNIRVRDGFLEILAAPKFPKLGMDSYAGWFGYVMPEGLCFIKRFPTYPDRVYNEVAGLTMSIWYPQGPMCELEPIGPRERIQPGDRASFTETWDLIKFPFPPAGGQVNLRALARQVKKLPPR